MKGACAQDSIRFQSSELLNTANNDRACISLPYHCFVLNGIEMCRSLLFDNSDVAAKRLLQIRSMSDGAAPGAKSFSIIGNLSIDM